MSEEAMAKIIGKNIANLLESKKMNQVDLANILTVSESTVGKWILGKSIPRMGTIEKISRFFNVSKSALLNESSHISNFYDDVEDAYCPQFLQDDTIEYIHQEDDTNNLLEMLKNDPQVRMVAKIHGELTPEGKKDLLKYAELLRNQKNAGWND